MNDMQSDKADRSVTVVLNWNSRAFRVLALVFAGFIVAGALTLALRFALDITSRQSFGFIRLFDLNEEMNAPTWFSSVLLLVCAAMLALITFTKRAIGDRWVRYWFTLSLIFVFMSMDETATIHERTMRPLHSVLELSPLFTNAWVLIAWPLLIVFLLLYLRFLLNLPRRTALLFCLSGLIYVTGVTGVELISGVMKFHHGTDDLRFALVAFVEESLEMLGLLTFIYSLADYAGREGIVWQLTFASRQPEGRDRLREDLTEPCQLPATGPGGKTASSDQGAGTQKRRERRGRRRY